jgi:hypothetical protein
MCSRRRMSMSICSESQRTVSKSNNKATTVDECFILKGVKRGHRGGVVICSVRGRKV